MHDITYLLLTPDNLCSWYIVILSNLQTETYLLKYVIKEVHYLDKVLSGTACYHCVFVSVCASLACVSVFTKSVQILLLVLYLMWIALQFCHFLWPARIFSEAAREVPLIMHCFVIVVVLLIVKQMTLRVEQLHSSSWERGYSCSNIW